ncbi:alpha/beta hydrolase [Pseudorhodoplanes sp.]|uniref:alpha/beta hydrolase n=1 Tax=Pseudorhodoplanes sp. TaxID=1934341 RepID=UPI002CA77090|nr:alpha/beta hydrolase [Pseudorhodoplanes sp.]HWV53263.1 alpha/beta hydrolase [Pseudorhodoplanes sp.]
MMRIARRDFIRIAAASTLAALPMRGAVAQQRTPHNRPPATQVDQAQIYLIRGLFGVFSSGMDQMAAQFQAQGYGNVSLWSWTDVDQISNDIIGGHQNGDNAHIILIGHSLGSNAVVQVADRLAQQAIPVDLAVTFDITEGLTVPLNVQRFVNFFQNNGFGRPAIEPAGFTGEFANINLSNQASLDHGNIDNAPQLQQYVLQQVYEITHTHVRTRVARRKEPRRG